MAVNCIFCGAETKYLRDGGPYYLTPFCLECVAPYGVTERSDTVHLLDAEILDQFYCTQPDPLPKYLLSGARTLHVSGRRWIATSKLTLNSQGYYRANWTTDDEPHKISSTSSPECLNWATVKRPPKVGETWRLVPNHMVSQVTILHVRPHDDVYPYEFMSRLHHDAVGLEAFVRRLRPKALVEDVKSTVRYHQVETKELLRFDLPPPPPAPDPAKLERAENHRRQLLIQLQGPGGGIKSHRH